MHSRLTGGYLRLITYGVISGDKAPIESIGLIGVREMYNALDVPVPGMAEAISLPERSLPQPAHRRRRQRRRLLYFDYIIQAMS